MATQIKVLAEGSVQFDAVGEEVFQGAVRSPVIRSFTHGRGKELEPQPGELVYQSETDGSVSAFVCVYPLVGNSPNDVCVHLTCMCIWRWLKNC